MERFNYSSLAKAKAESVELLYLMECASWGYEMDKKEQTELDQSELNSRNGGE